uniref:Bet v I/Major latex protein domain-containing protein n=1 Tax=Oryza punctata TaxID=4537 RepID=A0A0E0KRL5_ORYPU
MASKVELVVEVKSPADKLWTALRDSTELFPKIFPEQYKSIETVEGDGKSAGTVRLVKYTEGVPMVTFAKEKVEVADDEKKVVSYSVVDGELVSFYKNFRVTLQVTPKGGAAREDGATAAAAADGAVVSWTMDFDKASEQVPDPDVIKETAAKTFHDLDDYLLKN